MLDFFIDHLALFLFVAVISLLFTGFPISFVIGGVSILFAFLAITLDLFSWIEFFNIAQRVWVGTMENVLLIAVSCYVLMGAILQESGIARHLLRTMELVLRRVPGSMAIAVVVMGIVLAATTGIIGASVMILTMLALPELLRRGYSAELSSGVIAASATLGILIPPSIMLVIMGDMLALSVGRLFFGAMIPGLVLGWFYIAYVLLFSVFSSSQKTNIREAAAAENEPVVTGWAAAWLIFNGLVAPGGLIFAVLGSIFYGLATPTESAGIGVFGALVLAAFHRTLTWEMIERVMKSAMRMIGMIFMLIFAASAFAYVFRALGGDELILNFVEVLDLSSWQILFGMLLVIFLLGFVLDWMEIIFVIVPVIYPLITILDFGDHVAAREIPYWIGILIAVCLQTSFLTPPVGFALFYLKAAAEDRVRFPTIYRGVIPFVLLQIIGLGLMIMFPQIILWLPQQMIN